MHVGGAGLDAGLTGSPAQVAGNAFTPNTQCPYHKTLASLIRSGGRSSSVPLPFRSTPAMTRGTSLTAPLLGDVGQETVHSDSRTHFLITVGASQSPSQARARGLHSGGFTGSCSCVQWLGGGHSPVRGGRGGTPVRVCSQPSPGDTRAHASLSSWVSSVVPDT